MLIDDKYKRLCQRFNIPGHAHELTFSCYQNRAFLSKERTCQFLVDSISQARDKHQFDLWAYVFMPNHVHLVICPRLKNYYISDILLSIKQPVSRKAIAYLENENPDSLKLLATGQQHQKYRFWQKGGGYDRNITSTETLIHTIRYIHNNPVRKQLASSPDKWLFSSAKEWMGLGQGPITLDVDNYPMP